MPAAFWCAVTLAAILLRQDWFAYSCIGAHAYNLAMRQYLFAPLLIISLCICALAMPAECRVSPLSKADTQTFDAALAPLGLTSADLRLPAEDIGLWGNDKYSLN